jgi:hypothetical protein
MDGARGKSVCPQSTPEAAKKRKGPLGEWQMLELFMPAKAGIHCFWSNGSPRKNRIPAFAGMTALAAIRPKVSSIRPMGFDFRSSSRPLASLADRSAFVMPTAVFPRPGR